MNAPLGVFTPYGAIGVNGNSAFTAEWSPQADKLLTVQQQRLTVKYLSRDPHRQDWSIPISATACSVEWGDDNVFACCARGSSFGVGDASTEQFWEIALPNHDRARICALAFAGPDRLILGTDVGTIWEYDLRAIRFRRLYRWGAPISRIARSATLGLLVWADANSHLVCADVKKIDPVEVGKRRAIHCLRWNRAGTILIVGEESGTVMLWSAEEGICVARLHHDRAVMSADLSGDDNTLVCRLSDGTVWVWESGADGWTRRREPQPALVPRRGAPAGVRFHPKELVYALFGTHDPPLRIDPVDRPPSSKLSNGDGAAPEAQRPQSLADTLSRLGEIHSASGLRLVADGPPLPRSMTPPSAGYRRAFDQYLTACREHPEYPELAQLEVSKVYDFIVQHNKDLLCVCGEVTPRDRWCSYVRYVKRWYLMQAQLNAHPHLSASVVGEYPTLHG